jgi:hypothetical protein
MQREKSEGRNERYFVSEGRKSIILLGFQAMPGEKTL